MALVPVTSFAQAQDAEAAIRQGMELRKQGEDARALPYLEKAYQLSRTPRTAAQLGLVQMGLGYWVDAERHLDEALSDPDNYWVAKNRAVLEGARTRVRSMIGLLAITGQPAGAEVLVNGRPVGRLPLAQEVRIGKGPAEVEVRADGYVTANRSVTVAGGGRQQLSIALVPADKGPAAAPANTRALPAMAGGDDRARVAAPALAQPPADAPPAGRHLPRALAWGAGGLAVGALAFGGIELARMVSKKNDFNDRTIASPTADDPGRRLPECTTSDLTPACASLRSDHDSALTLAIVGFVAGGVLAAGSAALVALTAPSSQGAGDAGTRALGGPAFLGCAATITSAGIVCGARF